MPDVRGRAYRWGWIGDDAEGRPITVPIPFGSSDGVRNALMKEAVEALGPGQPFEIRGASFHYGLGFGMAWIEGHHGDALHRVSEKLTTPNRIE